jgi:hypothetical protein
MVKPSKSEVKRIIRRWHESDFSAEPKSKRTPVRLRHKIEKAGAAKQRKARKEGKKVSFSFNI